MTELLRIAALAGLATITCASPARAASTHQFDVPGQDLGSSLRMIGRQGSVDILFQPAVVAKRRSSPVSGLFSSIGAIRAALRAHPDLEAVVVGESTLLIRKRRIARTRAAVSTRTKRPRDKRSRDQAPIPIQEIVVTGARRPMTLSSYPGSLRVIDGDMTEQPGRSSLADASAFVPGLNLTETGTGQRRITIRGMQSAGENSVLLYIDETPVSGPNSATSDISQMSPDIRLYDIDRIEVLRGPQGTLFGSGALSGAVRVVTNRPDVHETSATATAAVSVTAGGGLGSVRRALINLPLVPGSLALRALAYDERRSGYVDNVAHDVKDVNRSRTKGARAQLRWEPAPDFDITLNGLYQKQAIADSAEGYAGLGRNKTDLLERLPFPNDLHLAGATGSWRLGPVEIFTSASYYKWNVARTVGGTQSALRARTNATFCPLFADTDNCNAGQLDAYQAYVDDLVPIVGYQPMEVEARVGELRLVTTPGQPLSFTGGLFYERRSDSSRSGTYRVDKQTGNLLTPRVPIYLRSIDVKTNQIAVFGDASWQISEKLALSAGTRRYSYRKQVSAQVLQTSFLNGSVAGPPTERALQSQGWTGRANLAYSYSPYLVLYAQTATGFRPGGVNSIPNLPPDLILFAGDSAISYEAGFRGNWMDGRIEAAGSVYWSNWRNMQTSARIPNFLFVNNSGEARVVGSDFDLRAVLGSGMEARIGINLLDGRLTRDQSNPVVTAPGLKGDRIPFEPRIKLAAQIDQRISLGKGIETLVGAELFYVGRSYSEFRPTNIYYEKMGNYTEASVHFELDADRWRARLSIANLFNSAGAKHVESTIDKDRATVTIAPRTVGVEFSWKFSAPQKKIHFGMR